jgi:hypothetical protein
VAADTSVHEEYAARIGGAGMSAQVVVPQVLGRAFVPVYR